MAFMDNGLEGCGALRRRGWLKWECGRVHTLVGWKGKSDEQTRYVKVECTSGGDDLVDGWRIRGFVG